MASCAICCENYTKVVRKPVQCPYCNYECCQPCLRQFLLTIKGEPNCISCHKVFSQDHLIERVGRHYLETHYRKCRESILIERERTLLPDSQILVKSTIEMRNLLDLNKDIDKRVNELRREMYELNRTKDINQARADWLDQHIKRGENPPVEGYDEEEVKNEKSRRTFIRPCPSLDCRGFLNINYVCGICETNVCSRCHEIKQDEHTCKPEDIESAKAIIKETRACPKCAVPIYKIDGCAQMWCSMCKTAFNWNTGRIETGNIHNPHYYEWLRQNNNGAIPRAPGDAPCGGIPHIRDIMAWIETKHALQQNRSPKISGLHRNHNYNKTELSILDIHRLMNHIQEYEIPRLGNIYQANADLRVKFLLNEISEKEFRQQLFVREKNNRKKETIRQVMQLFVNASQDIIRNYISVAPQLESPDHLHKELVQLVSYCNDSFKKVSLQYQCRVPTITHRYYIDNKTFHKKTKEEASTSTTVEEQSNSTDNE